MTRSDMIFFKSARDCASELLERRETRRRAAKRDKQINNTSNIQSVVVIVAFCSTFFSSSP